MILQWLVLMLIPVCLVALLYLVDFLLGVFYWHDGESVAEFRTQMTRLREVITGKK